MNQYSKTPVMVLQELCIKKGYCSPDYHIISQISGTHINRFDFVVIVCGIRGSGCEIRGSGSGPSKQLGRHQAAHDALMQLQELGIYDPAENPVEPFKGELPSASSRSFRPGLNCIMDLQGLCLENKMPYPEFVEISSVGPPHNKEFTYECKIASITTEAKASSKKNAKQLAAKEMLIRIKELLPDLFKELELMPNALAAKYSEAISQYQELREIVPDKSVKISDISKTLAKLMMFKGLKYEDFAEDLKHPSEEALKKILTPLETGYILEQFQEVPMLAIFVLKIDTPFTILASGRDYEEAKRKAIDQTFAFMDTFMQFQV
ncbi:RISC-loading complex subunit tarbp2 [Dendroctonus ponderosae]